MNDKENGNQEDHTVSHKFTCGECGSNNIETTNEKYSFPYGIGDEAVELSCVVPVRNCNNCGAKFLDDVAEELCHEEICRYKGVMTPSEIKHIRTECGFSQEQFAQITKLGSATLSRWERGIVIQNEAYDNYLFLLKLPYNFNRVRNRYISGVEEQGYVRHGKYDRFRVLKPTPEIEEKRNNFKLRPAVEA
jgi:putative zinc finger/helix-turn-helix YgiT family protein